MPLREVQIMNRSRVVPEGTTRRYRDGNFHNSYTTLNELGRGRFAVVRKCKHKETSRHFAAKFVRKRKMGRDCREDILKEIRILESSTLNPRLIGLHEVYETSTEVILVLEYASGGELHQYCVADKEDGFCERDVVRLLHQIIEGVHYLHKQNIAHLDLKPQNILLTSKEVGSGDIKLIDFGIARYLSKEEEIRDIQGTPDYVAPEILNYEPITLATDMWSVGVLTYVMLTGNSPFAGDTKQETFLNISQVNLEFPEEDFSSLSAEAQDFIQSLCIKEPEKRLSAAECLEHPWVRKFTAVEELERERTGTNENLQHQDENSNTSQVSSLTVELVIRKDKDTATITKLKDDENENYLENNVARFVSAKELEVSDTRTAEPVATEGNGGGMSRDDSISDMDVHMECDIKDGHEIFVSQEVKVISLEAVQPLQRSTTEGHVSVNTPEKTVPVAVPVQNHINHSTENLSVSPSLSEASLLGDRACQRCHRSHTDLQVVSLDRGHSPSSSPLGTRRGICPSKENLPSGISEPKRFCLEVPGQQPGQVVC